MYIGAVVFIAIQLAIVNFRVEGSSMRPTLLPGHYLMVNKLVYFPVDTDRLGMIVPFWQPDEPGRIYLGRSPRQGDVVVFDYPEDTQRQFVKRIIGEPGQRVQITGGQVIVDGARLDESYLPGISTGDMHPVRLGDGEYFVMGDNRSGKPGFPALGGRCRPTTSSGRCGRFTGRGRRGGCRGEGVPAIIGTATGVKTLLPEGESRYPPLAYLGRANWIMITPS